MKNEVVELRVLDHTGTHQLQGPQPLNIEIRDGGWAEPAEIAGSVLETTGLYVRVLRVVSRTVLELEYVNGCLDGFSWSESALVPPMAERATWMRPGWVDSTLSDVDQKLSQLGDERIGDAVQMRHLSTTALMRIPCRTGDLWLKAVPPAFRREPAVIEWLRQAGSLEVPEVLCWHNEWWLSASFGAEQASLGHPLGSLARLQIHTAGRGAELRALGCPDRSPIHLLEGFDAALALVVNRAGPSVLQDRLHEARGTVQAALESAAEFAFPETIVHGDFSPGNVRGVKSGWLLHDWTDVSLGHPFADLTSYLAYESDARSRELGTSAFATAWTEHVGKQQVAAALDLAPVVGAVHQMVNYASIIDQVDLPGDDPNGYEDMMNSLEMWQHRLNVALKVRVFRRRVS